MSAYKKIKCEIRNQDILVESLKSMGLEPAIHEEAKALVGYQGDKRQQTAEIIVSKVQLNKMFTGSSNDLGFKWNEKELKYDIICSDYDVSCHIADRVKQAYAKTAIEKVLAERKFTISSSTSNNNLQQRKQTKVNIVAHKVV